MKRLPRILPLALALAVPVSAGAQRMISGNENKLDLTSGAARGVANPRPDNLTLLDFATFPPRVTTLDNVPNTVIGPPSNIAMTPDGSLALIANSAKPDPADPGKTVPLNELHLLDLTANPPRVTGHVNVGSQPSGISITPDGKLALVANRAGGTVSVLRIAGQAVTHLGEVKVGEPATSASDVAIAPDGKVALVSLQKASLLTELKIDGEKVEPTGRKFSVYGQPYRVIITPDGRFAVTSGAGYSTNGIDLDAVSVVDLKADPPRAVQHLTTGSGPESVEISPDGQLLAVVTMDGSNLGPGNPHRTDAGGLYLYRRTKHGFNFSQYLPTGRIPEGVAFTSDGKYLVVQCHPDRELRLYRVRGGKVKDTGERIKVPGMPSSLRAATR
jgi:DNA-binding beta-propeller fold protein YncE